uniref:Predicted protein n=1 Tax=Hordeum vulgare subsp. vulgare TaxID=112509 RepID=F2CVU5_HORVV|nr:predicted protein [Hordeum vulgare subsp. vulgare]
MMQAGAAHDRRTCRWAAGASRRVRGEVGGLGACERGAARDLSAGGRVARARPRPCGRRPRPWRRGGSRPCGRRPRPWRGGGSRHPPRVARARDTGGWEGVARGGHGLALPATARTGEGERSQVARP